MSASRTFVDAAGRTLRVGPEPQRLVSLVPSITEALFDFGCGERVVGRTDYCVEPAHAVERKPSVGGTKNPDVHAMLALQPDLVLAVAEENRPGDVQRLERHGVPVYVFEPTTVRDGIDLLWRLAELLQCTAEVRQLLGEVESVYEAAVRARVAGKSVRVFCPIWKEPYMTVSEGTFVHDVLDVCGGDNVFAQRRRRFPLAADLGRAPERTGERDAGRDRRYPRVTLDEMAALRPEVILLPDEPYPFSAADLAELEPYAGLPAVRDGRVHLIDGKLVTWYGVRIAKSLPAVRALLSNEG